MTLFAIFLHRVQLLDHCQEAKIHQKRQQCQGNLPMEMVPSIQIQIEFLRRELLNRDYIQECCLVRIVLLLIMVLSLG